MLNPVQFWRLLQINVVMMRYAFNRDVVGPHAKGIRALTYLNPFSFSSNDRSRGESIRVALEKLGPIFVKFGQVLSTRHDLLPDDVAKELAYLQDRVPPFSGEQAKSMVEKALGCDTSTAFARFDSTPLASASIAQVHAATLHDGHDVIVKVLRPDIKKTIRHDIAIMYQVARLTERFWRHGKRLHLVDLVAEFETTIIDELDLAREAANASQLRRNFEDSKIMYVPKVHWEYTRENVMVMERIYGIQISDTARLKAKKVNMKHLAEYGVEIFFTQVFRDSFFHADMHPGNLFVDASNPKFPCYLGVDFGIMGTLNPEDQHYLAANLLAFFNRDYRQVAVLHVESGWVPNHTRVDQFESAIRTVCEPIFEKPLSEISFGNLLLRLFQTAERFRMEIQPQLMLLQKTLLAIEGLGRQLYPDLDLWATAKPFLTKWMKQQRGLKRLGKEVLRDFPETAENIIKTPTAIYDFLHLAGLQYRKSHMNPVIASETPRHKRGFFLGGGIMLGLVAILSLFLHHGPIAGWQWSAGTVAVMMLLISWAL